MEHPKPGDRIRQPDAPLSIISDRTHHIVGRLHGAELRIRRSGRQESRIGTDEESACLIEEGARNGGLLTGCADRLLFELIVAEAIEPAVAADPDAAVPIFNQDDDGAWTEAVGRGVLTQASVHEMPDAGVAAKTNPQAAVAGKRQRANRRRRHGGRREGVPRHEPLAVEPKESGVVADPQITVGILRQRPDHTRWQTLLVIPGRDDVVGEHVVQIGRARRSNGQRHGERQRE